VALRVLAIGPLFIVLLPLMARNDFFEAWVYSRELRHGGVLAVLVASLLMTVVEAYAVQTAAKGAAIPTVDALTCCWSRGWC
jgi:type IV secretion system protein VirB6